MNRAEAQARTTSIRNIRGCYALLRNTRDAGIGWMPAYRKEQLSGAVINLADLVAWLDSIRSERAKIRAGVLCKDCKKPYDYSRFLSRDGYCKCSEAIAEDRQLESAG